MREFTMTLFLEMIGSGLVVGVILGSIVWFFKTFLFVRKVNIKRLRLANIIILTSFIGVILCFIIYSILSGNNDGESISFFIILAVIVSLSLLQSWGFLQLSYSNKYSSHDSNIAVHIYYVFPFCDSIFCITISSIVNLGLFTAQFLVMDGPQGWIEKLDWYLPAYIGALMATCMSGLTCSVLSVRYYQKLFLSKVE